MTYQAQPGRPCWALDRRQPQASEPVRLFQEILETLRALHPTPQLCNRPCSPLVSLASLRNGSGCGTLGSTGLRAAHCHRYRATHICCFEDARLPHLRIRLTSGLLNFIEFEHETNPRTVPRPHPGRPGSREQGVERGCEGRGWGAREVRRRCASRLRPFAFPPSSALPSRFRTVFVRGRAQVFV